MTRHLIRPKRSVFLGVCAAIANRFDIDPAIVRVAFLFFTLFGGSGLVFYLILALLIPVEE